MIRHVPLFFSILSLICAVAVTVRLAGRELTWAVPLYVCAQCLLGLFQLAALQRTVVTHNWYIAAFNLAFLLVLATAAVCVCRFLTVFEAETAGLVLASGIGCALGFAYVAVKAMRGDVLLKEYILVWQGAILLSCGLLSMACWLFETRLQLKTCMIWLGLFWLVLGFFFLAYTVGNLRLHTQYQRYNIWLPSLISFVAFAGLAFSLSNLQAESARETVPQNVEVTTQ